MVIIVFVSLITVLFFFAGLYFYYVRGGKQKVETFITEHKRLVPKFGGSNSDSGSSTPNRKTCIRRPSLPTMPSWTPPTMPKMPLKMPHVSVYELLCPMYTFLAIYVAIDIIVYIFYAIHFPIHNTIQKEK